MTNKYSKYILSLALALFACLSFANEAISYKVQTQLRFDDRSNREQRFQYRVRAFVAYDVPNSSWSAHAFAVTGEEFSSSYNTIDSDVSDHFHLRRLYLRYTGELGNKTEIGVIPTYKGRVSSTGLAKDGWIKGARQVYGYSSETKFELVLGELQDDEAKTSLDAPKKLNYVELEISSLINDISSYEFSLERMSEANFARAEYRLFLPDSPILSFEFISRLSSSQTKIVMGLESSLAIFNKDVEYYAYYSYVSDNFGPRSELTEDFITTGHGVSIEADTAFFGSKNWKGFARFDVFDQNTRFILGVSYTLK